MANLRRVVFSAVLLLGMTTISYGQTLYTVQDLGGDWRPSAISNNRMVVGSEWYPELHAVKWFDGQLSPLPVPDTFWGDPVILDGGIAAVAIDDAGDHIVGWIHMAEWNPAFVAYWEAGTVQILDDGIGEAINAQLQIAVNDENGFHGYILENGIHIPICDDGAACPYSEYQITALNNVGQALIGGSPISPGHTGVSLWEDGNHYALEDLLTEAIPIDTAWAVDINDLTQFIGSYSMQDGNGDWSAGAFLFDAGRLLFIGDFAAKAINESGQVVGETYLYQYDLDQLIDLNGLIEPDAGWRIDATADINDEGVIVGRGRHHGADRALMLIPCDAAVYGYDADVDGYGDPSKTVLACAPPEDYVAAVGVTELVVNGAMEGDSNWHDRGDPAFNERSDAQVHRGHYARTLSADSAHDGIQSEAFRLRAGGSYRATFYVYGDGSAPLRAQVGMNAQNQFPYKADDRFPVPPPQWTRYSWTFTARTAGDYTVAFALAADGEEALFHLDDVSVTEVIVSVADCDDRNAAVHPGAAEICNARDDDCDGSIDEGVMTTFYRDADGDGFGDHSHIREACSAPPGYVAAAGDCDDADPGLHPVAAEICNDTDDDCDGRIDEGVRTTYYRDADGDGYGDPGHTAEACAPPSGFVLTAGDCDDGRAHVFPAAVENCNRRDDDCDGEVDEACIENRVPVADAGADREVIEGATVRLDGSASQDPDDEIDTWRWVQVDGPSALLSDPASQQPSFVTPPVPAQGARLLFQLTVADLNGAVDTATVAVTIADNGITGFPEDVITLRANTTAPIGFKILAGGSLVAIDAAVHASRLTAGSLADDLLHGPLQLRIRTHSAGANVTLACYVDAPLAETHTLYLLAADDTWRSVADQARFNTDRTRLEIDLVNGGQLDQDGSDDGQLTATLKIARAPQRQTPTTADSGSDRGCFIGTSYRTAP